MIQVKKIEKNNEGKIKVYYVASKDNFKAESPELDKIDFYFIKIKFNPDLLLKKYSVDSSSIERTEILAFENVSCYDFSNPKISYTVNSNPISILEEKVFIFIEEAQKIIRKEYGRYQLQTMLKNGLSIDNLIDELQYRYELLENESENDSPNVRDAYENWYDSFGYDVWLTEDEWIELVFEKWINDYGFYIPEEIYRLFLYK